MNFIKVGWMALKKTNSNKNLTNPGKHEKNEKFDCLNTVTPHALAARRQSMPPPAVNGQAKRRFQRRRPIHPIPSAIT